MPVVKRKRERERQREKAKENHGGDSLRSLFLVSLSLSLSFSLHPLFLSVSRALPAASSNGVEKSPRGWISSPLVRATLGARGFGLPHHFSHIPLLHPATRDSLPTFARTFGAHPLCTTRLKSRGYFAASSQFQ